MSAASSKARPLRQVGLFALGAVAVHQARYALAIAAGAHETGAGHRHGYLGVLIPAILAATCAAVCVSLLGAALRRRVPAARQPDGATERAALFAAGLLAVYLCQELAEGLITSGPSGLADGIVGAGGWLVVPLAMLFGAATALLGGALDRVEERLAVVSRPQACRAPRRLAEPPTVVVRPLASRALAFGLARRPPPAPVAG
ncbi:MAG: hypothetical protein ACJ75R_07330 [Solirubrobacterales bacterium]